MRESDHEPHGPDGVPPGSLVEPEGADPAAGHSAASWVEASPAAHRKLRVAIVCVGAYAALQLLGRFVRLPAETPWPLILTVVLGAVVGFMVLTIVMTAALTRLWLAPKAALIALVAGVAGWLLLAYAVAPLLGTKPPQGARVVLGLGVDLFRTTAAVGIGALVAALIRDRNILLPAALFAAFADYFMVHYGTVHVALSTEKGQKLVQAMSAKTPEIKVGGLAIPTLTVGMADIVFIAFFMACAIRLSLNARGTLWAFSAILPAALVYVLITGRSVPALLPMALAFVVVNWRCFRLTGQERRAVVIAAVLVVLATAGFFVVRALGS